IVQDYLFEANDMECQIDLLLIFQNECVLVEVKNYAGLYRVENKEMYFMSNGERLVKSPFNQVDRAKMLLTQLFKEEGIRLSITEKIVFPNEEFYLYGDTISMPSVYHTTFPYFIKRLNQKRCALGDYHQGIYEKLMRRRLVKSKYEQPIVVEYDTLAKGITCECGGWMKSTTRMKVLCETCGADEKNESAIMRMTEHFVAVFPDRTLTATEIYYWIDGEISKRTITRILGRNFDSKGTTRGRHFLYEEKYSVDI
uniref:nuclease-related domain-containing protein n=1 Tax=Phocicoccus schoeneichii TaxID=1812261 RepID=UPI003D0FA15D